MSTYKYTLYDYHAIKQAEITIDGITVLAGDNGCGKSTLSRWLYYLVNTSSRFEELLFHELKEQLESILRQGRSIARELSRYSDGFATEFTEISTRIHSVGYYEENSVHQLMQLFEDAMMMLNEALNRYLVDNRSEFRIQRMNRYLQLNIQNDGDVQSAINTFVSDRLKDAEAFLGEFHHNLEERSVERLFDLIHAAYRVTDSEPQRVQLSEDGVKLLRKNELGSLLALDRAIYVDTPMALNFGSVMSDSIFWQDLRTMMKGQPVALDANAVKLLIRIRQLIGGEVKLQQSFYNSTELHYIRKGDNLNIRLEDTATGMKTFAYIQKLVENGYLNERTLLLIDEPEAHLHPKWIFEFAHLLVLLNKDLGVKVMVASHNPDMVAALQKVAEIEGLIDNTHFYQAYPQEGNYQFEYRDLGGSISEIFRSFNIATSRIQDYGEPSNESGM